MKVSHTLLGSLLLASISCSTWAQVRVTPWLGYTAGGSVENQDGEELDLKSAMNFAVSLETDLDQGRVGLFYTSQRTDVEEVNADATIHYLLFQSSAYYPLEDGLNSYIGLGLGGSYVDAVWVDDSLGFSTSIFAGMEYVVSDSIALTSQVRWLGTAVDNETSGVCQSSGNNNSSCVLQFKTDWMDQFSANIGLVVSF